MTISPLDQITPADEPRAGGKAFNCARLKQAGFQVPDGIVVLSHATDDDVARIAEHPWFDQFPSDAGFAVRSSGIGEDSGGQSFAGIHQTLLGVGRGDLVQAVRQCRASAHTRQAMEYRRAQGLATAGIQIAVLIQRMIQPVAAGVAFTVNPVSGAANELVINSSWGVGEALVSGQVDPDEFVFSKHDRKLLWSRAGEKTGESGAATLSLSPYRVQELAAILIDIERHYGSPQDVEWCHDGAEFWIVQSRPVTAPAARDDEIEWTRANLAEVLPDLTAPQPLAMFEDLLNVAEKQSLGRVMAPADELGPMVKPFYGRLYFNLSQLRRACALGRVRPAETLRSMGHAEAIQPADEQLSRLSIREHVASVPDLLRILFRHLRASGIVRDSLARMDGFLQRVSASDPRRLSDDEIWAVMEEWLARAPDSMQTVLLLAGVLFHEAPVRTICERVGFPFERLVYPQLAAGERSVSAQQAFDLIDLADVARRDPAAARYVTDDRSDLANARPALRGTAFADALDEFLKRYGHRGRYESDWSLPRYHEDPTPLLRAIRAHLEDPSATAVADLAVRQERDSAEAWAAFTARLSPWQRKTVLPRVRARIRKIKQYYLWREKVRSEMIRVLSAIRGWHLALAERFVERGWIDRRDDYFLIDLRDIGRVIKGQCGPDTLRPIAAERAAQQARYRPMSMPLFMRESELARLIRTAGVSSRSADENELSGHPVSGGCVEAEVVVIRDPADFGRMKAGAILVAPATDPSWTPLFTLASGVIVEVGGVLSHASTIAREYGLPALANVKHATRRLRTGERVRLDAVRGVVQRLEPVDGADRQNLVTVG